MPVPKLTTECAVIRKLLRYPKAHIDTDWDLAHRCWLWPGAGKDSYWVGAHIPHALLAKGVVRRVASTCYVFVGDCALPPDLEIVRVQAQLGGVVWDCWDKT